eukprot:gene9963-2282_t
MGQKHSNLKNSNKIEKGFIFLIRCSNENSKIQKYQKSLLKGIQKDLMHYNFIFEELFLSLNYGIEAQQFYTKTEKREILFWFEDNSLLKGIKKSILENIESGKDVILNVNSDSVNEIQEYFSQETIVFVVELKSNDTIQILKTKSNWKDTETLLNGKKNEYEAFKKKTDALSKSNSKLKKETLKEEKEKLIDDILTRRDDVITSIGRTKNIEKSILFDKITTIHSNYCFKNPKMKCCEYNTTELCNK